MSSPFPSSQQFSLLRQALRQCRVERNQRRRYAMAAAAPILYPSLHNYPPPKEGFRPSQATKQNRIKAGHESGLPKIRSLPQIRSALKICPDPIQKVTQDQLAVLDPTGARTRLFAATNPDRVKPGDVLLVRLKTGDPYAGVCLNIRKRHQPIDTAVLLRNQLTRVGVEMWFKVYSPNVEGIEIVQRKAKRARRAKLYYMRHPKHDMGNVDGIVRQYMRQKIGGPVGSKQGRGGDAKAQRKKTNQKGRK